MRALAVLVALFALLAFPALAAAPKRITPRGVGKVKLGAKQRALHRKGLVSRMLPGCELAGPKARGSQLRKPLAGAVELTRSTPRRVRSIIVTKGATARGVGIGDRKADILAAYPKAKFDTSTQEVFRITLVRIPKDGGGRLQMALRKGRVSAFGIPYIAFCE
jgi:hypothetical protein